MFVNQTSLSLVIEQIEVRTAQFTFSKSQHMANDGNPDLKEGKGALINFSLLSLITNTTELSGVKCIFVTLLSKNSM